MRFVVTMRTIVSAVAPIPAILTFYQVGTVGTGYLTMNVEDPVAIKTIWDNKAHIGLKEPI